MRNILLALLAAGLLSCQDDNQAKPQLADNMFSAQRNGKNWGGITEIRVDENTDSLTFLGIGNQPNDEVVVMKIKFQGLGHYTLIKNQALYYSTVGGDVITSEYKLAPNAIGQLTISKYDVEEELIEGNFKLLLNKKWSYLEDNVDVLNLSDGCFRGKIAN